jgi:hypothetical protein
LPRADGSASTSLIIAVNLNEGQTKPSVGYFEKNQGQDKVFRRQL